MRKYTLVLLIASLNLCACHPPKPSAEELAKRAASEAYYEKLEKLYHQADTVFTHQDSVFVVNAKLDTVVVATGIFACLRYDFPLSMPDFLVDMVKQAALLEQHGQISEAATRYKKAVDYYEGEWLHQKGGYEDGGYSDLNDRYQAFTQSAILASYAYEKLHRLPQALATLRPYMANVEAEQTCIQVYYVSLCMKQYGRAATKKALDECGKTVIHRPNLPPEADRWTVNLFDGQLDIDDFNRDTLTPADAQQLVRKTKFYKYAE